MQLASKNRIAEVYMCRVISLSCMIMGTFLTGALLCPPLILLLPVPNDLVFCNGGCQF